MPSGEILLHTKIVWLLITLTSTGSCWSAHNASPKNGKQKQSGWVCRWFLERLESSFVSSPPLFSPCLLLCQFMQAQSLKVFGPQSKQGSSGDLKAATIQTIQFELNFANNCSVTMGQSFTTSSQSLLICLMQKVQQSGSKSVRFHKWALKRLKCVKRWPSELYYDPITSDLRTPSLLHMRAGSRRGTALLGRGGIAFFKSPS